MAYDMPRLYTDAELGYTNPYPTMEQDDWGHYKNPLQVLQQLASQPMPYGGFDPNSSTYDDATAVYRDMIQRQRTPEYWSSLDNTWKTGIPGASLASAGRYGPRPREMEAFQTAFENMQKITEATRSAAVGKQNRADELSWQIPQGQPGARQGPTSVSGGFPEVSYGEFRNRKDPATGLPQEFQPRFAVPFGKPNPMTSSYMEQGPDGGEVIPSVTDTIEPSYRTAEISSPRLLQLTGLNAEKFQVPRSWLPKPFSGGVMEPEAQKQTDVERRGMQDALNARMSGIRDLVHNHVGGSDFESNKRKAAMEANAEGQLEQLRQTLAQIHGVQYPYQSPKERAADKEAKLVGAKDEINLLIEKLKNIENPQGLKDAQGNVLKKYGPGELRAIGQQWATNMGELEDSIRADIQQYAGPEWLRQYRKSRPSLPPWPYGGLPQPTQAPAQTPPPTTGEKALDIFQGGVNIAKPFIPAPIRTMQAGVGNVVPFVGNYFTQGEPSEGAVTRPAPQYRQIDTTEPGPARTDRAQILWRDLQKVPKMLWPLVIQAYQQQMGAGNR